MLRANGFDHVVRAQSVTDDNFKVYFTRNREKNARLGIIVGKKILAGAADRNCLKRTIREAFRQHSIKLCNLDLVVMVKRTCPQRRGSQDDNLKMLLSRVERRCAEL
ncbi:MAG: ribonuclease P protein component [Gallionellales bacterium RIFCSPLOWO2_02_FULL_59_110]|nr:MAG: ribonuclease P protein component [Gallionellales bacterium RIFCSPLOWO2_02_FULL_59_110]OGT02922.1 MAG: ribonuclease P protein component [Gallionellales bacterium RIFCSPLOWO2_02_58_13]